MPKSCKVTVTATAKELANFLLAQIGEKADAINKITSAAVDDIAAIEAHYKQETETLKEEVKGLEKTLVALMKKERGTFFDGTDVLQLTHGALIHEDGYHVKIPKGALAKCEELKFDDVIKVVKSLDREAIEKWKDEKLLLIGAQRKMTETFSYDLKKEKT
jgi:phage host-nuclease inhibitor protein Gam